MIVSQISFLTTSNTEFTRVAWFIIWLLKINILRNILFWNPILCDLLSETLCNSVVKNLRL
jgi:hypothetical protein